MIIIYWRNENNGRTGHGSPMDASLAAVWVERMNAKGNGFTYWTVSHTPTRPPTALASGRERHTRHGQPPCRARGRLAPPRTWSRVTPAPPLRARRRGGKRGERQWTS